MHRQRYSRNPEFNGLGEIVWKYLQGGGDTAKNMHKSANTKAGSDNMGFLNQPVWHNKPGNC